MDLNIRSKIKHPLILLLLCGGFLLLAPSAKAFFGIPFEIYSSQLSALSFIGDTLMEITLWLAMLSVEAATFLAVSAALLDWSSGLQINLRGNPLVDAGWNFTTGIANLLFILIFIAIALSYIFKAETFGMKKALPRLIIIALFINFSLLFVEIFVDIGWIVQNSVRTAIVGSGGFAYEAMRPVIISLEKILAGFVAQVFIYFPLALIPFAPLARLLWWGTAVVNEFTTGAFSRSVLLIIFASATGFTFLVYSVIFLIRIVIIWLLAIAAPLAFMAFILPSTQKFFSQWFRLLIQWIFLGVVMFFLMGLGIKLFAAVAPDSTGIGFSEIFSKDKGWFDGYVKMLFLIVYLWVAFSMSRKFVPTSMNFIQSWTELGMKKGNAWGTREARKRAIQGYAAGLEARSYYGLQLQEKIKARKEAGLKPTTWQRFALRAAQQELSAAKAGFLRSELIKEERRNILKKTEGMDEEGTKAVLRAELEKFKGSLMKNPNMHRALAELLIEKNALKKEDQEFIKKAWETLGRQKQSVASNPIKRGALKRMLQWADGQDLTDILSKLTPSDIENLNNDAKDSEKVAEEIVRTNRSDLIGRLAAQNAKSLENVQKQLEEQLGKKWETAPDTLKPEELRALRNLHSSSAFSNINLRVPGSLEEIAERIKGESSGKQPAQAQAPKKEAPKIVLPGSEEAKETEEEIKKRLRRS